MHDGHQDWRVRILHSDTFSSKVYADFKWWTKHNKVLHSGVWLTAVWTFTAAKIHNHVALLLLQPTVTLATGCIQFSRARLSQVAFEHPIRELLQMHKSNPFPYFSSRYCLEHHININALPANPHSNPQPLFSAYKLQTCSHIVVEVAFYIRWNKCILCFSALRTQTLLFCCCLAAAYRAVRPFKSV